MKTQITIEKAGDEYLVTGPYSGTNIAAFKSRGGRWVKPAWRLPASPGVETMFGNLFGKSTELVEVEVNMAHPAVKADDGELLIGGYQVASRRSRDSKVEMPTGVRLWEGAWLESGGSMAHPSVMGRNEPVNYTVRIVVRKDFAETNSLKVVSTETPEPTAAAEVQPPAPPTELTPPVPAMAPVDPRFVELVKHCVETLNLSDGRIAGFGDSGTETVKFFWSQETAIKALAAEFGLTPASTP